MTTASSHPPNKGRKFIFAVDLDGVCADYVTALKQSVAKTLETDVGELTSKHGWNFTRWDFDKSGDEFIRHHTRAVTQERIFRDLQEIGNVSDRLHQLADSGIEIRIVTQRGRDVDGTEAEAEADTKQWIKERNLPHESLHFVENKPDIFADVYIDDAPHHIEAFKKAGKDFLIFDQPYNQHIEGPRVKDWDEVAEAVQEKQVAHQLQSDVSATNKKKPKWSRFSKKSKGNGAPNLNAPSVNRGVQNNFVTNDDLSHILNSTSYSRNFSHRCGHRTQSGK